MSCSDIGIEATIKVEHLEFAAGDISSSSSSQICVLAVDVGSHNNNLHAAVESALYSHYEPQMRQLSV